MKRTFECSLLATVLILASTPDPLHAQSDDLPQILTESELAEARGGFVVAGMEIRLGADLRTYLNGELALRTTISWEDDGPKTDQWVSATLAPASALAIGGILANGNLALNVNGQPMFLANEGQTALLQRTDGQIQNVAFNTASGIDLRQEADISLAVANYQMFRDAMAPAILMSGLGDAISHAAIGATAP